MKKYPPRRKDPHQTHSPDEHYSETPHTMVLFEPPSGVNFPTSVSLKNEAHKVFFKSFPWLNLCSCLLASEMNGSEQRIEMAQIRILSRDGSSNTKIPKTHLLTCQADCTVDMTTFQDQGKPLFPDRAVSFHFPSKTRKLMSENRKITQGLTLFKSKEVERIPKGRNRKLTLAFYISPRLHYPGVTDPSLSLHLSFTKSLCTGVSR